MFKSMNHGGQKLFISDPDKSSTSKTKSVLFHQVYSISETTMQIYKGSPQPREGYLPVVTRINPKPKRIILLMLRRTIATTNWLILEYFTIADPHIATELNTAPSPDQENLVSSHY